MRRSHVFALLSGLILGIGIGGFVVWQLLNTVTVPAAVPPHVAAIVPAPAPAKPIVRAKLRKSTVPTKTAETRRNAPIRTLPAPIQMGDGTIFSGADPNDPRIYHFAD